VYSGSAGFSNEAVVQTFLNTSWNLGTFEDQVMDKVLVVEYGLEGGCIAIYGRQQDGIWSFWREGCAMADVDEEGNDLWRFWESEPVQELSAALSEDWPLYCPGEINPVFLDWFRNNYDKARSQLVDTHQNFRRNSWHERWMRLLSESTDKELNPS
jgi:hypothetical protein